MLKMHRWQRGQMHGIANPENREFKSHPVLQNKNKNKCKKLLTSSKKFATIDT